MLALRALDMFKVRGGWSIPWITEYANCNVLPGAESAKLEAGCRTSSVEKKKLQAKVPKRREIEIRSFRVEGERQFLDQFGYGYGSIPINTINIPLVE